MSGYSAKARSLVVGVADYAYVNALPDMVRRDAVDIAAALASPDFAGHDPAAVCVLTNRDATVAAIRDGFSRAAATTHEDDIFFFYFSGHGARLVLGGEEHSCLAAYDTAAADLAGTSLVDSELLARLAAIKAKRQVIILDACHSGGVGSLKSAAGSPSLPRPGGFDALATGRGRVLLCSSRPEEVSLALPTMSNSVFTAVLLDALRGAAKDRGDGTIGVFDLFSYVSDEVPRLANQHPVFKADALENNFAVARYPVSKAGLHTPKALPLSAGQQIEALLCALYPLGPMQDKVWQRAGGDASRLEISGSGVAQWHTALRILNLGGGGLSLANLLDTAAEDYPSNETLGALRRSP